MTQIDPKNLPDNYQNCFSKSWRVSVSCQSVQRLHCRIVGHLSRDSSFRHNYLWASWPYYWPLDWSDTTSRTSHHTLLYQNILEFLSCSRVGLFLFGALLGPASLIGARSQVQIRCIFCFLWYIFSIWPGLIFGPNWEQTSDSDCRLNLLEHGDHHYRHPWQSFFSGSAPGTICLF